VVTGWDFDRCRCGLAKNTPRDTRVHHYEYLVKKILDSKMFCRQLKFKIKWEGYGPGHDSWEYATEVYTPE
jgi:hypothetical protein